MSLRALSIIPIASVVFSASIATAGTQQVQAQLDLLHFSHPADWKSTVANPGSSIFIEMPKPEMTLAPKYLTRIWVAQERTPTELTLEKIDAQFIADSTIDAETRLSDFYYQNFSLISKEDSTLLGHPARTYVFMHEKENAQLKAIAIVTSFGGRKYEVSMHAMPELFSTQSAIFQQVAASLTTQGVAPMSRTLEKHQRTQLSSSSQSSSSQQSSLSTRSVNRKKKVKSTVETRRLMRRSASSASMHTR